jgi:tetratricopeptide (TPR) repeat protein
MGISDQDPEQAPQTDSTEDEVIPLERDTASRLVPEFEAVSRGETLLYEGKHEELIAHCEAALKNHPKNLSLWKLMGVAEGSSGNLGAAKASFFSALHLDPQDPVTLGNYIQSCFDTNDKAGACSAVEEHFGNLDFDGQVSVLEPLLEAVRSGQLTFQDLPAAVLDMLTSSDS